MDDFLSIFNDKRITTEKSPARTKMIANILMNCLADEDNSYEKTFRATRRKSQARKDKNVSLDSLYKRERRFSPRLSILWG